MQRFAERRRQTQPVTRVGRRPEPCEAAEVGGHDATRMQPRGKTVGNQQSAPQFSILGFECIKCVHIERPAEMHSALILK